MPFHTDNAVNIPTERIHHKWLLTFIEPAMTAIRNEPAASVLSEDALRSVAYILFKRLEAVAEPVLSDMLLDEINRSLKTPLSDINIAPSSELSEASARLWKKMLSSAPDSPDAAYPLLRPELVQTAEYYAAAITEMLRRIYEHREDICHSLLNCPEFVLITYLESTNSDPHRRGRCVFIIHTPNGRFLYKPRDTRIDAWFRALIQNYFPDTVLIPECLSCGSDYGFCRYIENRPASSPIEAERFFFRMGSFCAILTALGGTDFHRGNFLADGSMPAPIDLETLLGVPFPDMLWDEWGESREHEGSRRGSFCRAVIDSAFSTSMLPAYLNGEELSPLADLSDINASAPVVGGKRTTVFAYREAFLSGFQEAYRHCIRIRSELHETLLGLPNVHVRKLFRDTAYYGALISSTRRPACFRSERGTAARREHSVIRHMPQDNPQMPREALRAEEDAILRGDIPLFFAAAHGKDLLDENGECLSRDFFPESPVSYVSRRLNELSEERMKFETAVIEQTFDSAVITERNDVTTPRPTPTSQTRRKMSEKEARDIAVRHFNDLKARLLRAPGGVSGFCANNYTMRFFPLQPGLMLGSTGIAVFCAATALACRDTDTGTRALELCDICLEPLRSAFQRYALRKKLPEWFYGSAGISGLSGYIKAVMLTYRLLGREQELELAQTIVSLLPEERIRAESASDLYSGLAGMIAVLCRFPEISETERAKNTVRLCTERLLSLRTLKHNGWLLWQSGGKNWPFSGAAHGCAGIGYALATAARTTDCRAAAEAAEEAFAFEHEMFSDELKSWPDLRTEPFSKTAMHGYCSGAPGIGAILLRLSEQNILFEHSSEDLDRALDICLTHPILSRDHFCCGNSASVDFLIECFNSRICSEAREKAGTILKRIYERARSTKNYRYAPDSLRPIWNPTLYYGASGAGYEYLRYADPPHYPSLML